MRVTEGYRKELSEELYLWYACLRDHPTVNVEQIANRLLYHSLMLRD